MPELIAIFSLIISILGLGVIIWRKIPTLVELAEASPQPKERKLFSILKDKIKTLNPFKKFSWELFLQKILSKIRILSLKIENKAFHWLQKLREKSKKDTDDYWGKIKKSIRK